MVTIKSSVGRNGVNRSTDVVAVQNLLNRFISPTHIPVDPLEPDGIAGNLTKGAIGLFQSMYLGFLYPDKRVDPAGKTLAALNGPVTAPKVKVPLAPEAKSVVRVLRGSAINAVHFTYGAFTVQPGHFRRVADAIESGRISVVLMEALGNNAEYHHKNVASQKGVMFVGFERPLNTFQKSVIVHEAAHAVGDYWGTAMSVHYGESMAHLAQGLYYYSQMHRYITGIHPRSLDVLKVCVDIAKRMKKEKSRTVTLGETWDLACAVFRLPTVSMNAAFFYDGI